VLGSYGCWSGPPRFEAGERFLPKRRGSLLCGRQSAESSSTDPEEMGHTPEPKELFALLKEGVAR